MTYLPVFAHLQSFIVILLVADLPSVDSSKQAQTGACEHRACAFQPGLPELELRDPFVLPADIAERALDFAENLEDVAEGLDRNFHFSSPFSLNSNRPAYGELSEVIGSKLAALQIDLRKPLRQNHRTCLKASGPLWIDHLIPC